MSSTVQLNRCKHYSDEYVLNWLRSILSRHNFHNKSDDVAVFNLANLELYSRSLYGNTMMNQFLICSSYKKNFPKNKYVRRHHWMQTFFRHVMITNMTTFVFWQYYSIISSENNLPLNRQAVYTIDDLAWIGKHSQCQTNISWFFTNETRQNMKL